MTPEQAAKYLNALAQQFGKAKKEDIAMNLNLISGMLLTQQQLINELRNQSERK